MEKQLDLDKAFKRMDVTTHRLPNSCTAYYIPDFVSESQERELLSLIESAPSSCWTSLKRRRLQCWGGTNPLRVEPIPIWCQQICKKMVMDSCIFDADYNEPNHILINEYAAGQGIMPHKDGPAYYGRVAIISLISTLCISFYSSIPLKSNNKECPANMQIILEPRSCLIFEEDLYREMFHTIHECPYDIIDENVGNLSMINDRSLKIGNTLPRGERR